MDRVRRLTADHMVRAKRIAPHVHSFIEIDFTSIDRARKKNAARWEQQDVKVSYTAFVAWACAQVIKEFPMVNAIISGENIIYRRDVNVGIAVDLNPGLIVPVIKNADELNVVGIAKRITDLAERARGKKLKPDEIAGATFSITNPGVLGTIVGMPIIPEGTAAILGTGAIEKRVVVVQDADGNDVMAIRKRSFFSLGYDHRLVDGADAARFMSRLKQVLESVPEDA
jgi:2-oxoglutarate dehydrogenase E2 component (dihydrolipoamide succinyltransferase)